MISLPLLSLLFSLGSSPTRVAQKETAFELLSLGAADTARLQEQLTTALSEKDSLQVRTARIRCSDLYPCIDHWLPYAYPQDGWPLSIAPLPCVVQARLLQAEGPPVDASAAPHSTPLDESFDLGHFEGQLSGLRASLAQRAQELDDSRLANSALQVIPVGHGSCLCMRVMHPGIGFCCPHPDASAFLFLLSAYQKILDALKAEVASISLAYSGLEAESADVRASLSLAEDALAEARERASSTEAAVATLAVANGGIDGVMGLAARLKEAERERTVLAGQVGRLTAALKLAGTFEIIVETEKLAAERDRLASEVSAARAALDAREEQACADRGLLEEQRERELAGAKLRLAQAEAKWNSAAADVASFRQRCEEVSYIFYAASSFSFSLSPFLCCLFVSAGNQISICLCIENPAQISCTCVSFVCPSLLPTPT